MDQYKHHVSGFFARRIEAEDTSAKLVERGLSRKRMQIFSADSVVASTSEPLTTSDAVLQDVLVDGAIGTVVGTGIGALAEIALVAANVTLFIASPLVAPLMLLGWGASIGAFIGASAGATAGAGNKHGWFSDLVRDAISSGQVVLVVETLTEQETLIAKETIQAEVGECEDAISK